MVSFVRRTEAADDEQRNMNSTFEFEWLALLPFTVEDLLLLAFGKQAGWTRFHFHFGGLSK